MILDVAARGSADPLSPRPGRTSYRVDGGWYDMETLPPQLFEPVRELLVGASIGGVLRVRAESRDADLRVRREGEGVVVQLAYPG